MKPTIIVIDSGYIDSKNEAEFELTGFSINKVGGQYVLENDYVDSCGHGTGVTHLIRKFCPEAKLVVCKILDENFSCEFEKLLYALEYIQENIAADIINISFGAAYIDGQMESQLARVLKKIDDKGTAIISAYMNEGAMSYPACMPTVFGVDSTKYLPKMEKYIYQEIYEQVRITGKSGLYRINGAELSCAIVSGTSYTAAYFTGMLASWKKEEVLNYKNASLLFKSHAYGVINGENVERQKGMRFFKFGTSRNAACFPVNKELHSLFSNIDMLPFKIAKVYDTRYLYATKKLSDVVRHIDKENEIGYLKILNIDELDLNDIDFFILGHTEELSATTEKDYVNQIIERCIRQNIPIYSLSDISDKLSDINASAAVFTPKVTLEDDPRTSDNKLWCINSPVLGVFGTGSSQGKFTLQLILRKMFLSGGYDIAQLGTEPTSPLFKFDYVYPMGHMSTVTSHGLATVRIINEFMHEMDKRQPDIIIVGGQSGCVNYLPFNLQYMNTPQAEFLSGTSPDAIVLCFSPEDSLRDIRRTLSYCESYVANCKVIALVLYPIK